MQSAVNQHAKAIQMVICVVFGGMGETLDFGGSFDRNHRLQRQKKPALHWSAGLEEGATLFRRVS